MRPFAIRSPHASVASKSTSSTPSRATAIAAVATACSSRPMMLALPRSAQRLIRVVKLSSLLSPPDASCARKLASYNIHCSYAGNGSSQRQPYGKDASQRGQGYPQQQQQQQQHRREFGGSARGGFGSESYGRGGRDGSDGREEGYGGREGHAADEYGAAYGVSSGEGQGQLETIEWQAQLTNRVELIGHLSADLTSRHLPSGKLVTSGGLAVNRRVAAGTQTDWYQLDIWGDLGRVACASLRRGSRVFVSGRLAMETWSDREGQEKTKAKVSVVSIAHVASDARRQGMEASHDYANANDQNAADNRAAPAAQAAAAAAAAAAPAAAYSPVFNKQQNVSPQKDRTHELWFMFSQDPDMFDDFRGNKPSPRFPDFKLRETGEALWVDSRNNPNWVQAYMEKYNEHGDKTWGHEEGLGLKH